MRAGDIGTITNQLAALCEDCGQTAEWAQQMRTYLGEDGYTLEWFEEPKWRCEGCHRKALRWLREASQ